MVQPPMESSGAGVIGPTDATPADAGGDDASVDASVESWLAGVAAAPAVTLRPELGEVIGGVFRIERPLGEGGMGMVYLARDLTLVREVAIKFHRVAGPRAAERLLAEARAAAKIAHENVLVVYEAGGWNDQVFIAMEYVDGWTARQWIHEAPRSKQEVVALYLEAGRGLAAAHAHGLVHRDFKPDNVLVARAAGSGGRGRARIADFGLARAASEILEQRAGRPSSFVDDHGRTDGIAGSPAYMAPEQRVSAEVDARADQYAFCVALYEGLFERHPFAGAERSSLASSGSRDAIVIPRDPMVPPQVRGVLRRGLSPDPESRFPSMDALLDELGRDRQATRRRRLGLAAAVVATGLVTWAAMRRPDPLQGCADEPAIQAWWTPERGADLQAALLGSGRPFASDLFEHIDVALTERVEAATRSLTQACQATFVEGTRSSVELQAHRECLTQRGREVTALLEVLGEGAPEVVDRAFAAVDGLTPVEQCDGKTGDDDLADVSPQERPAVDAALELIAKVRELEAAGRFDQAIVEGDAGLPGVRALGRPRLLAQLLLQLASNLSQRRDFVRARALLREAGAAAVLARAHLVAAEVGIEGIYTDGCLASDTELGDQWAALSAAWLDLAGSPPKLRRKLIAHRGMAHGTASRFEAALADQTEALALLDQDPSPSGLERASMLGAIAVTHSMMGHPERGLEAAAESVAGYGAALGEQHPTYAWALGLLGGMQAGVRDFDAAERTLLRSIEIGERLLGPHSSRVIEARTNLGGLYSITRRHAEAMAMRRRVLDDARASGRPDSPGTVVMISELAKSHGILGEFARARELQAEATALAKQVAGADSLLYGKELVRDADLLLEHAPPRALEEATLGLELISKYLEPSVVQRIEATAVHAMALGANGRCDDAVAPLEAALADYAEQIRPDHPGTIDEWVWLGRCRVELGRWDDAIVALERASRILAAIGDEPGPQVAELLARARAGRGTAKP